MLPQHMRYGSGKVFILSERQVKDEMYRPIRWFDHLPSRLNDKTETTLPWTGTLFARPESAVISSNLQHFPFDNLTFIQNYLPISPDSRTLIKLEGSRFGSLSSKAGGISSGNYDSVSDLLNNPDNKVDTLSKKVFEDFKSSQKEANRETQKLNYVAPLRLNSDINFLKKEFAFTKLKYSRSPQYDAVSGGFAALLAGFVGFLISEKFGIELVDSGDFFIGFMYVVFMGFIGRLIVITSSDLSSPKFSFSMRHNLTFFKTVAILILKKLRLF